MGNSAKGCYVENPDALSKQVSASGRVRSGTVRKQPNLEISSTGNSISDGVAASPEGRNAAIGALSGSLIPLVPVAVAMGFRLPFEKPSVRWSVATTSVGLLCWAFGMQKWFDRHKHTHFQPTTDPAHIKKE